MNKVTNEDDDDDFDIEIDPNTGAMIFSFTDLEIFLESDIFASLDQVVVGNEEEQISLRHYRVPREVSMAFERVANHYLMQYKNGAISSDHYHNKLDSLTGKLGRMVEGDGLLSEFE